MCNEVCYTVRENALTVNCSLIFKPKRQFIVHLFFLFFSLTIKDKTNISLKIKILHLRQGSFTRKVRTIFTLKIIVSIFVKLFLILVLHLRQFFIEIIFVKRATEIHWKNHRKMQKSIFLTNIYMIDHFPFLVNCCGVKISFMWPPCKISP